MKTALPIENHDCRTTPMVHAGNIQDLSLYEGMDMRSISNDCFTRITSRMNESQTLEMFATANRRDLLSDDGASTPGVDHRQIAVICAAPTSFSIPINSALPKVPTNKSHPNLSSIVWKVLSAVLTVAAIASTALAAPAQSGISYSRDFLKAEQKSSQESISDIERSLDAASRLLDAGLPGAPEHLVRALFLTDLTGIRLEGQSDRISQLKSSLGYIRAEEQRRFTATYADLRRQIQTAELRAAALCKQGNPATNVTTILQIFQSRQGEYRNLIRAGLIDVKTVLDDCNRQLIQAIAAPKPEPKSQKNEKTAADVALLKREQAELQVQLNELRRAKESERHGPAVAPPVTIIVTNEIVRTIEKPMPAPAPVVVTNTERIFITNIVAATTNPAQSLTASVTKTNETLTKAASSVGGNSDNSLGRAEKSVSQDAADPTDSNAVSHKAVAALPRMNRVWLISAAAVVLVLIGAVMLGLTFANRRQNDFEISLTCGLNGHEESITLAFDPNEQCVVLSGERPNLETRGAESDQPCIVVRSFGGPQLRPGAITEVRLNGELITKRKRLSVGDVVQVNTSNHGHSFTFQGGNFVSGEEQPTSFESVTTTIN